MSTLKIHIAKVAAGTALSFEEAREAFDIIMSGDATPGQIGGFLMALRVRGETVSEISGAVATMRAKMLRVDAPVGAIDIVGTGVEGFKNGGFHEAQFSDPQGMALVGKNRVQEALPPVPEDTVESVKEDVQWTKAKAQKGRR